MRLNHLLSLLSVFFFAIALSVCARAQQANPSTRSLPDLTNKPDEVGRVSLILDGKPTVLDIGVYVFVNLDKLERHYIQVLYKSDGGQWLALDLSETGKKLDNGAIVTDSYRYLLFENVGGKWELVKEFKLNQDENSVNSELKELMKSKYNIEDVR